MEFGQRCPLRGARAGVTELRAPLASTNEARHHEFPSTGVGAGGRRDRSLDRRTPVVATLPPVHAVSHCHDLGNSAYVRNLAMRLIWSWCRRRTGSRLQSRGATTFL